MSDNPLYDLSSAHHASMASLVRAMGLPEAGAVCLPAVLEVAAKATRRKASAILFMAHTNADLRVYIQDAIERLMAVSPGNISAILEAQRALKKPAGEK